MPSTCEICGVTLNHESTLILHRWNHKKESKVADQYRYCNIGDCEWRTFSYQELVRHRIDQHKKGNNIYPITDWSELPTIKFLNEKENYMEQQMEQVWRSKDGVKTGSKEEVEAYLKTLNPLSKMRFPYGHNFNGIVTWVGLNETSKDERKAVVAFANLAPLIQEVIETWGKESDRAFPGWRNPNHTYRVSAEFIAIADLLFAYEEALKQVPQ